MARSQTKNERIAFIACTSLAIGIIAVIWVASVRAVVGEGVRGTKAIVSDVSATAGAIRRQSAPDPETVAEIKGALTEIVTKRTEKTATADASTVDAVAQLMKHDVETYGQEPKN